MKCISDVSMLVRSFILPESGACRKTAHITGGFLCRIQTMQSQTGKNVRRLAALQKAAGVALAVKVPGGLELTLAGEQAGQVAPAMDESASHLQASLPALGRSLAGALPPIGQPCPATTPPFSPPPLAPG